MSSDCSVHFLGLVFRAVESGMSVWSSTRVCHPETDNNKRYFKCDDEQWQYMSLAYSRRHKNGDVSVPFRSVETERELCRLPFYHLHTTVAFPFRSVWAWPLAIALARAIGSTPRPCS